MNVGDGTDRAASVVGDHCVEIGEGELAGFEISLQYWRTEVWGGLSRMHGESLQLE